MKKFFKYLLIFMVVITVIGVISSLFMSENEKFESHVNYVFDDAKNAESVAEFNQIYNEIDSLKMLDTTNVHKALFDSLEVQKAIVLKKFAVKEQNQNVFDAWYMAKKFLTDRLKSPSSAKFASYDESRVSFNKNIYQVQTWVDAQNSFGAMIRGHYKVTLSKTGDQWTLVNIGKLN